MRWDDIELLRWIDELQSEGSYMGNGLYLLQQLAQRHGFQQHEGLDGFSIELELAHEAGYVSWTNRSSYVGSYSARNNPMQWLQTIDDVKLTLEGRDRARGRFIQLDFPDPTEDDGRMISGLTLEEIARSIGPTYTATQLPKYLVESGLPSDVVPSEVQGDKWEFVNNVLEGLADGGSAARRSLREFIGSWLDGRHHEAPTAEVRNRIVTLLARQGWHVLEGRLVVGERVYAEAGAVTPLGRDARVAALHAEVRQVITRFVEHLDVAVFEAFKAVINRVKRMAGETIDGSALIDRTMALGNPVIRFSSLISQTDKDVQQGLQFLFKGAAQAIRNPDAHEQFQPLDDEEALKLLAFASMLMRRLDSAEVDLPTASE